MEEWSEERGRLGEETGKEAERSRNRSRGLQEAEMVVERRGRDRRMGARRERVGREGVATSGREEPGSWGGRGDGSSCKRFM